MNKKIVRILCIINLASAINAAHLPHHTTRYKPLIRNDLAGALATWHASCDATGTSVADEDRLEMAEKLSILIQEYQQSTKSNEKANGTKPNQKPTTAAAAKK